MKNVNRKLLAEINRMFTLFILFFRFQLAIGEVLDECASWRSAHSLKTLEDLLGTGDVLLVREKLWWTISFPSKSI